MDGLSLQKQTPEGLLSKQVKFLVFHLYSVVKENIRDRKSLSRVSTVASSLLPLEIRKHIKVTPRLQINASLLCQEIHIQPSHVACSVHTHTGYVRPTCGLPVCIWCVPCLKLGTGSISLVYKLPHLQEVFPC